MTIAVSIPVTPNGAGGCVAPTTAIPDVGTGQTVQVTWSPEECAIISITGNPPFPKTSRQPDGSFVATYLSPASRSTWNYTIVCDCGEGAHSHDPVINNEPPTMPKGKAKPKAKAKGKAKAKPAAKVAVTAKAKPRKAAKKAAPAKKAAARKAAPARKAAARKAAPARKAPARKAAARKAPARKAPARKAAPRSRKGR